MQRYVRRWVKSVFGSMPVVGSHWPRSRSPERRAWVSNRVPIVIVCRRKTDLVPQTVRHPLCFQDRTLSAKRQLLAGTGRRAKANHAAMVGENSIGMRLACRSFHAATRRPASSRICASVARCAAASYGCWSWMKNSAFVSYCVQYADAMCRGCRVSGMSYPPH